MNLAERMKRYEKTYNQIVQPRMPLIIRVDVKAAHTLVKRLGAEKPFDDTFAENMDSVAKRLVEEIQNSRVAYIQSDEISVLLVDFNKFDTDQWFDGKLQKIVSVSAAIASASMTIRLLRPAYFDSRVISLPEEEVCNYFVWRQRDWIRNSIEMVARAHFSHKELHKVSNRDALGMLKKKDIDFETLYNDYWKLGRTFDVKNGLKEAVKFETTRDFIEQFLAREEM